MNREAWMIFLGLAVAAGVGLMGYTTWQKQQELLKAQTQLAEARAASEAQSARLAEAWQEVEAARKRAEALNQEMSAVADSQKRLETEMRAALESREVAISDLEGRLTLTILDRILFDSGDATIKPEGKQVLDQVAKVLARYTNRPIQVIGHTDNVPIRLKFASNWELSTARAVSAVRYLTEVAGVDPKRLSAVGCGEFQPIADNSTAEGRAKNRRIALVVLPELFVPTDVPAEEGATNAPAGSIPLAERPAETPSRGATAQVTNTAPVVPTLSEEGVRAAPVLPAEEPAPATHIKETPLDSDDAPAEAEEEAPEVSEPATDPESPESEPSTETPSDAEPSPDTEPGD